MDNFDQNAPLSAFAWEGLLEAFVRRYRITLPKLELLLHFFRRRPEAFGADMLAHRTGYLVAEVQEHLERMAADGLLTAAAGGRFRAPSPEAFAGRSLLGELLERLPSRFAERDGRLQIIYAVLKVQALR